MSALIRRAGAVGIGSIGIWVGLPKPARADNCSGLSDCSVGIKIALVLAAIVLAVLLWEVIATFAVEAVAETAAVDAFELEFSETAASHLAKRPFMNSRLLIQEIMESGEPVLDPQGAANTVRWDVPGSYKGVDGTWELVVNTAEKIIYHFNFVR